MSLKVIKAVYASRLESKYRPLAAALAFFCGSDDGRKLFPGAERVADALGVTEVTVRHGFAALQHREILVPVGYRRHTREFRIDLDALRDYRPSHTAPISQKDNNHRASTLPPAATRDRQRATSSRKANKHRGQTLSYTATPDPHSVATGTLSPAANNPVVYGQQPCRQRPTTLSYTATPIRKIGKNGNDRKEIRHGREIQKACTAGVRTVAHATACTAKTGALAPEHTHTNENTPDAASNGRPSHALPARKDEHVITPKLSLAELVKLVASRVLREADDSGPPNLEALARQLCAEYGVVNAADVDVVISGARASASAREKLFVEGHRYPTHVHTDRRRRGARPGGAQ